MRHAVGRSWLRAALLLVTVVLVAVLVLVATGWLRPARGRHRRTRTYGM